MTNFIGLSFGAISDRVCVIAASTGVTLYKREGFSTREAIAALLVVREQGAAHVVYDSAVDFELMFQDLSSYDKDRLFGVWRAAEERIKDTPLYEASRAAEAIDLDGIRIAYLTGKICRISNRQKRKSMAVYDIAGYFENADIEAAAKEFLPQRTQRRIPKIEKNELALWRDGVYDQVIQRCEAEAQTVVALARKVEETIEPLEIRNRQWYGPSAVASRCLSKWQARRQGKRLNERNSAHELLKAIDCAYFGGRVEAVKLGTVQNVSVLDLNSAYAYATTLLSQFARPLRFSRKAEELHVPFSVWFCEYDLPGSALLGVLPARAPRGAISFRRTGKGYFWQPELEFLMRHYPGCYKVGWGYVARDAKPVTFADDVRAMYDYRQKLKAQGDAGQKIIKLALSNLYGKFAQNTGGAFYQCRAWAGWITSYIRRLLLEAARENENKVVCFAQDAVHFDGDVKLSLPVGEGLGEWKRTDYAKGLYLAPGMYDLQEDLQEATEGTEIDKGKRKTANRGSNLEINFEKIARELSARQASELQRVFFVGYALSRQASVKYGRAYLSEVSESLQLIPGRLRARNYDTKFDWLADSRSSRMNENFSGLMSSRYFPQESSLSLRLRLKERGWV